MKSIFFPFEQMINFIDYQREKHPFRVVACMLILLGLFCLSNLWLALIFLALLITYISYSLIKRSAQKKQKKSGGLFFGFVICVFLATVYDFTTKYYNEDLDITAYWPWWLLREHKPIHIYSGEKDGNYYKMMDKITRYDSSNFQPGKVGSSGGYENPNRVMLDQQGLSFVKEDIYSEGDKIRDQVSYVALLYMEKLHIVYNKNSPEFKKLSTIDSSRYLSLGYNDDALRETIRNSRIAVGKTGSSTKILSAAVLSEISRKKPSIDVFNIENAPLDSALKGIRNGKYDIIFLLPDNRLL